jgi:hypothetical protein
MISASSSSLGETKEGNAMRNSCSFRHSVRIGLRWNAHWLRLFSIGREVAIPVHLQNGQGYTLSTRNLIKPRKKLFMTRWTSQEARRTLRPDAPPGA